MFNKHLKLIKKYFLKNPLFQIQLLKIDKITYFVCGNILYQPVVVKYSTKKTLYQIVIDVADNVNILNEKQLSFTLLGYKFILIEDIIIPINNIFSDLFKEI